LFLILQKCIPGLLKYRQFTTLSSSQVISFDQSKAMSIAD